MRRYSILPILMAACLIFLPSLSYAQADNQQVVQRVDQLVKKHYMDGIQYEQANALGKEAIPHLLELLHNPAEKQFWVNVIVTLGFIEDSSALDPLISFLESAKGEVDGFTFRAMTSVPFAIGCVASNGDRKALEFLKEMAKAPPPSVLQWSFGQQKIENLLTAEALTGLAVSGRPEARTELLKLKSEIENRNAPAGREFLLGNIKDGLQTLDRMNIEGRSRMFNPQPESR
ncbi:MAG: HEAT repeat domain-containing protein [Syntrophobacteraceae bacterium]